MVFSARSICTVLLAAAVLGAAPIASAQQHFTDCLPNTANDATVVLPEDATVTFGASDSLRTGDEIAVYSDDGTCVGAAVWDSSKSAVSIPVADRDSLAGTSAGYVTGETLKYRIWRSSDGSEFEVSSASYDCTLPPCRSDGTYERNAVFEVAALDASSSLPVELTEFAATRRGEAVVLNWRTASETNNSGFKVQHQTASGTDWQTLSFVEGAGTSSRPHTYRYEAEDLGYGRHAFRLAQIDRDGSATTTKTVEVAVGLDSAYEISKVAPNPIRQTGSLDLTVKKPQRVVVRLYDLLGREVGVYFNRSLPADQTKSVQLNTDRLSSGQYFLRIEGESFRVTRRVTVVK
jgi:hypothetical protein